MIALSVDFLLLSIALDVVISTAELPLHLAHWTLAMSALGSRRLFEGTVAFGVHLAATPPPRLLVDRIKAPAELAFDRTHRLSAV